MTDLERLHAAFDELEGQGFAVLRGELCCQSCSIAALPDDCYSTADGGTDRPFAYWHEQDHDSGFGDADSQTMCGQMMIGYGSDLSTATRIVATMQKAGFLVDWDGTTSTRIGISRN